MNKKQITALWIGIIAALIVGTLIGFPYLVSAANGGALFSTDTMISLYIAAYTLEATLLIAFLIYSLQNNAAGQEGRRRTENAKRIIYTELAASLEAVVRAPRSGNTYAISDHLSDLFLAYLPDMQHCLNSAQLHHLIQVIDILTNMAHLAVEDSGEAAEYIQRKLPFLVQVQFYPAMVSPFSDCFADLSDYRCVLNADTRSVLEAISEDPLPAAESTCLRTKDGKKIAELLADGLIKIYDREGALLCDAVLDDDSADMRGIQSGWAKLPDYEGEFLNGVRHGRGCSYSTIYHHKIFDGTWAEGNPEKGTRFDIVVEKCLDSEDHYEELFPYWSEWSLAPSNIMDLMFREDKELDLDCLYVCDIYEKADGECGEESNVRPLLAFIEQEDPLHCDILKLMQNYKEDYGTEEVSTI